MNPGSRGPVVIDTGVFAARLTPREFTADANDDLGGGRELEFSPIGGSGMMLGWPGSLA